MPPSIQQRMAAFQKAAKEDNKPKVGSSTLSSSAALRNNSSIATRPSVTSSPKKLSVGRIGKVDSSFGTTKSPSKPAAAGVSASPKKNRKPLGGLFGRGGGSIKSPTGQKKPVKSVTSTNIKSSTKPPGKLQNASVFIPTQQPPPSQVSSSSSQPQQPSEKAQRASVAPKATDDHDWKYLYELAIQYDQYKLQEAEEIKNPKPSANPPPVAHVPGDKTNIKSALEGLMGGNFAANGNFLTHEYISKFLIQHPKFPQSLTFDFGGQAKLFKRFDRKDAEQRHICIKFVDALVSHPRSGEITCLNFANTMLPDIFLEVLVTKCCEVDGLPKLQVLNLESNLLGQGDGIPALARAIADPAVWRRLQVLRLENQKMPLTSTAEEALGPAVLQSPSLVVVSLSVRGGLERQQINNTVAHNVDLMRQARRHHATSTGTLKERKRNEMEIYFDKIASNADPTVISVDLVGNIKFLGLNPKERTKTGAAFATNKTVTTLQLVKLQLDDDFCTALGQALATNTTLEKVVLDSNCISGSGIRSLFEGLGRNTSIVEFQVRHQSKTTSSADEQALPQLLEPNRTLTKLGVDLRDQNVKRLLDNKTNENREYQRKLRGAARKN